MASPAEIAVSLGEKHGLTLAPVRWGTCRYVADCPQCKQTLEYAGLIGRIEGDLAWLCEGCAADLMLCGPRPRNGRASYLTREDMKEHQRRVRAARDDLGRAVAKELEVAGG